MHINQLSDDCILHVFRFLDINERVKYEIVCRHWRRLLPGTFSDMQRLDVAEFMTRTYKAQSDSIQFAPTVVGLLSRCGPFLREIGFGSRWLKVRCVMSNCGIR